MKLKLNLDRAHEKLKNKKLTQPLGHILLVDDERENLDGLEALLSNAGYRVTATTSPDEAIDVVRRDPVDLVISDQRMPVMLGTEMLEVIREQRADNIRVILTGHTDMNDLIHCINQGLLYRYLVKPWNAQEVLDVVSEGMKKIKVERSTQRLVPSALWRKLYSDRLEETTPGKGRLIQCSAVVVSLCDLPELKLGRDPSELFVVLSRVIGAVESLAERHNGYLSHTLGERAVLVFEGDVESRRSALDFMRALPKLLAELNRATSAESSPSTSRQVVLDHTALGHTALDQTARRAPARDLVSLSAGAHTGEALLGMVGDQRRLSLTMIGGAVDVAMALDKLASSLLTVSETFVGLTSSSLIEQSENGLVQLDEQLLPQHLKDHAPIYQASREVKS